MTASPFVHLHCHSHYSLLDGAGSLDRLIDRAKTLGMNALALTDHGNLYGALEFYQKATAAGIKPILGYEAYVAPAARTQRDASSMKEASYHLTLLAQNRTGFKNLLKLASTAFLDGFYFRPRIDKKFLQEHSEGIICLSGCASSELNRLFLATGGGDMQRARETAEWFRSVFGDRYFIEIQDNGLDVQKVTIPPAVDLAQKLGVGVVATSDVHYVLPEDADAQDILLCVNTGKFRTDAKRMKMDTKEFYVRSPEEMYERFAGLEDTVRRSQEIADRVDIDLELGKRNFPVFTPPNQVSSEEYLRQLCLKGLSERYKDVPKRWNGDQFSKEVMDRLDRELGVINKLGFPNYFLIVWDFVHHARSIGIEATARGSGVGSLVAYSLYLSHVCPLEFDLLFERFLDENRKEAPDIDIDFCQERRGEVIQYVKQKYGTDNVAQIATFGTLQAKAAIRDVGRALGLPIPRVNAVVAMIPSELHISIAKALEKSDDLRKTYEADPEVRELLDLAQRVEGLARNVGTHAAAVVIADQPLVEYLPLQRITGKEEIITQWAMGDVEKAGLLKMDFLGLRNLTILSKVVKLIEQTTGKRVNPYEFPLDDKATYALLCRGETKGVFQLESGGIRDLLQRMKPDHFRDIIATNALYRPGPLEGGMVDDYIEVKHGRKRPEYKHPVMKEILEETNAVMVYQEQVMRILNRLGGIKLANAYTCIKAISKKKLPIIEKFRGEFIEGAQAEGLAKSEAEELFGLIEKFAGYGFNKCVVGSTRIVDAQSGERTTVEELFRNRRPFHVHSLGEDGTLRSQEVSDVLWNGRKPVFRLTTATGKQITATGNHPFRTLEGWRLLEELRPGDRIAAPRHLTVTSGIHWPEHEIIALAHLIAEGNTCHPTCLYFYNNDRTLIDDFCKVAERFPSTTTRVDCREGRRFEVCVSTGEDTRFKPNHAPWNSAKRSKNEPPRLRCGMRLWAEGLGIVGKSATQKYIPPQCFSLSDDGIALLLGRLWSGDGYVGAKGQLPYYATSSRQLASDVQLLLLRLGIVSRTRQLKFNYKYKERVSQRIGFTVHVLGADSLDAFVARVVPHIVGRKHEINALRETRASLDHVSSKDTIPAEVRSWVDRERREHGMTWRDLQCQSGCCVKELVGQGSRTKRGFRRTTVNRLARFLHSEPLRQMSESDIFWETVVRIEPAGIEDTYDLTVENDHNYVADGLVVHNSHSTAYALVAYMTAYLKAHYPVEFMAALLSSDMPGRNFKTKDSLVEHLEDCQRMQIEVVPPDVNRCHPEFAVENDKILFGLAAVKGCGYSAAEAIVAARTKGGPFKSIFDFCDRLDAGAVNRTAIESLVKAGAFDGLKARRAQLFAVIDKALQSGAAAAADRKAGQKSLFGDEEDDKPAAAANLPELPEWDERDKLNKEKEVLGFYLSSHPLAQHAATLAVYCSHTNAEAALLPHRHEVMLGGMLAAIKLSHTKNPRPGMPSKYAMFDLEDMSGIMRCILWPEQYAQFGELVQPDTILAVQGVIDKRPGSDEANFIVNQLIPLDDLAGRFTRGIVIRVLESQHGVPTLEKLYEILRGYPGSCELQLLLVLADGARVPCHCEDFRVDVNPEMRRRVEELLGPGNIRLLAAQVSSPGRKNGHNGRGR